MDLWSFCLTGCLCAGSFLSTKQFRESYGTNPAGGSEESLYPSMSDNSKSGGMPLQLTQKRSAAYKKRLKAAQAKGLTELVGSTTGLALAATGEYSGYAHGETLLAVSAPGDSAAGRACGERCASLNRAFEDLAAVLAVHEPSLTSEKRLLLATLDGSKNSLPSGVPDPAADAGAALDLRYPTVYITRRTVEDIDEIVDPEFFHPNVTLLTRLLPETVLVNSATGAWSPWHLLSFVAQHAPDVGISDALLDELKPDTGS